MREKGPKFYYGMVGMSKEFTIGGGYVPNIMVSAASLWVDGANGGHFKPTHFPRHGSLALDPGGFSLINRTGDYPFDPEAVWHLARRERADLCFTLDYPCEPEINRPRGLRTNRERILKTVQMARRCLAMPWVRWVPVIQGYEPEEYVVCLRQYERAGIKLDYVGVGSLCVRKRIEPAWAVIRAIRDVLPKAKLHAFGLSKRFLKDRRFFDTLYSCDSCAWHYGDGSRYPRTAAELLSNFGPYSASIERIRTGHMAAVEG